MVCNEVMVCYSVLGDDDPGSRITFSVERDINYLFNDLVNVVDAYFSVMLLSFFLFMVNLSKVAFRFAFFGPCSRIVSVGPISHPT